ncbi:hypothetical protein P5673_016768 [Acropora cervicornis]|uniref:Uncharacterized protein n=1 Tax=Acropora cervicornis TaxID=6130 RepID=A0AAD9QFY3_ACRCE|nr:hypothetical protein P5673_016768 [Acropora cervicornis]
MVPSPNDSSNDNHHSFGLRSKRRTSFRGQTSRRKSNLGSAKRLNVDESPPYKEHEPTTVLLCTSRTKTDKLKKRFDEAPFPRKCVFSTNGLGLKLPLTDV